MKINRVRFCRYAAFFMSLFVLTACGSASDTRSTDPVVENITPDEAKVGEKVTIRGSNFGNEKGNLGGLGFANEGGAGLVAADTIVSWSDTEIEVIVPDGALTGSVKVKANGKESDGKPMVVLWAKENPQNSDIAICTDPANNVSPLFIEILSEVSGDAIIVWGDYRNSESKLYAQRLNSAGKIKWAANGVLLSSVSGSQYFPQMASDGASGAIVVWQDYRSGSNYDIYAQRISNSGAVLWSDVAVSLASKHQEKPQIVSDGSGGAIIVWHDYRSNSRYDIYAQRIDKNGVPQWTADGVAISTALNNSQFLFPRITSDDSGGAIIVWQDQRDGRWDMYAQRIDSTGAVQWTENGILVSTTAAVYQYVVTPVPDGIGGAIIVWESVGGDLYAQRIDGSGTVQWGDAGKVVLAAADKQRRPEMISDDSGGVIVTWEDYRVGSASRDVYAQRIDDSGFALWTSNGVAISTAAFSQFEPQIASDGSSGAIITWHDYRDYNVINVSGKIAGVNVYAQKIDAAGNVIWDADGMPISEADLHQMYPKLATDRVGGAVIVWEDSRNGNSNQIFAQGISKKGRQ